MSPELTPFASEAYCKTSASFGTLLLTNEREKHCGQTGGETERVHKAPKQLEKALRSQGSGEFSRTV